MTLSRETIKQVLAVLSTPGRRAANQVAAHCDLYSAEDCERYIDRQMDEREIQSFETHCFNCFSCLEQLYLSDVELSPEREKQENEQLLLKTRSLMDQLKKKTNPCLLDTIIRITDKTVELLSTTGTLLQSTQPVPIRGPETAERSITSALRIMQDIPDSSYSLQTSINAQRDNKVTFTLSVYDQEKEEFSSGVKVGLKNTDENLFQISDENGEVTFKDTGIGRYELTLSDNEKVIGTIVLTIV